MSEIQAECAHVAYTSSEGRRSDDWYFDSGSSRRMTGNKDLLGEISPIKGGKVIFGDGMQGRIQGVGHTENSEEPHLTNVYLVDGLKANLIRIIQLCDEGLNVIFTKVDCKALDERGDIKLQGIRSWNNCYMWNASNQCLVTVKSQLDIWHIKL